MIDRLLASMEKKESGCWEWSRGLFSNGYGQIKVSGKPWGAHRAMFLEVHGYLPEVVMHSCDNKKCVNPEHLIGGTHKLNAEDRDRKKRNPNIGKHLRSKKLPLCKRGHAMSGNNLRVVFVRGYETRQCRKCRVEIVQKYQATRKEARRLYDKARYEKKRHSNDN